MTRLVHLGAETGHIHSEGLTLVGTGTSSIDTSVFASGARSFKFDSTGSNLAVHLRRTLAFTTNTWHYVQFRLRCTDLPAANTRILTSAGKLQFLDGNGTQVGSDSTTTIATGSFYRIAMGIREDTDGLELRVNGVSEVTTSSTWSGSNPLGDFSFGFTTTPGASKVIYIDDLVINDDQGTAIQARPFLLTRFGKALLPIELYTDQDTRIR